MYISEAPHGNNEYAETINEYSKNEEELKKEVINNNTYSGDYKNETYQQKKVIIDNPEKQEVVTNEHEEIVTNKLEEFISYYDNGAIKEKGAYVNGKKQGIWISYNEKGAVTNKQEYKDGHKSFDGIILQEDGIYDVPGISKNAKNISCKQFPRIKFGNCRLTQRLGSVIYSVGGEEHKETYYSQRVLPGKGLNIPGRHVAQDKTVRDGDGYIVIAANYIQKGSTIMTTLGPGKVYDTGGMKGKRIDVYTDWG